MLLDRYEIYMRFHAFLAATRFAYEISCFLALMSSWDFRMSFHAFGPQGDFHMRFHAF
jgi:hypothetical protein